MIVKLSHRTRRYPMGTMQDALLRLNSAVTGGGAGAAGGCARLLPLLPGGAGEGEKHRGGNTRARPWRSARQTPSIACGTLTRRAPGKTGGQPGPHCQWPEEQLRCAARAASTHRGALCVQEPRRRRAAVATGRVASTISCRRPQQVALRCKECRSEGLLRGRRSGRTLAREPHGWSNVLPRRVHAYVCVCA